MNPRRKKTELANVDNNWSERKKQMKKKKKSNQEDGGIKRIQLKASYLI